MKVAFFRAAFALGLLGVTSCDALITGCKTYLGVAVQVRVVDAQTGAPAVDGATVVIRGSSFADSVVVTPRPSPLDSLAAMWFEDRIEPGRYTVTVRKAGYREWTQSVRVERRDGCHTSNEVVTARLERL
jgi:hypothetical protein